MQTTLMLAGVAFVGAAIVGGGLIAFKIEIPLVDSVPRQIMLGAFGVVLMGAGLLIDGGGQESDSLAAPPTTSGTEAPSSSSSPGLPTSVTSTSVAQTSTSAPPEAEVNFEDPFDSTLEVGWEWLLEKPEEWTLTSVPGWLQITAADVEQNTLLREAPNGDYEITTALRFRPSSNFQLAGLTVRPKGNNVTLLQFGRSYCDPDLPNCIGDGVYFDDVEDGELIGNAVAGIPDDTDVLYLRIVADGDSYRASFSVDLESWTLVGEHLGSFGSDQIGIVAHQAFEEPVDAHFDYVTVLSPPPLRQLPTFEEVSAGYPAGPTCETKVDVVAANPDGSVKIRFPPNTPLFDDRIEFPCWGMRITVLNDVELLGTKYSAGSVLVVSGDSDAALMVDETEASTSATVGVFADTWAPPDGLSFVVVAP